MRPFGIVIVMGFCVDFFVHPSIVQMHRLTMMLFVKVSNAQFIESSSAIQFLLFIVLVIYQRPLRSVLKIL